MPWAANGAPRRAGVSSFGISGTNAHVILEEAPVCEIPVPGSAAVSVDSAPDGGSPDAGSIAPEASDGGSAGAGIAPGLLRGGVVPWVLSAKTLESLREQAGRLREFVARDPQLRLQDIGFTLAVGRSSFEHRAVVLGEDREELLEGLGALAQGLPAPAPGAPCEARSQLSDLAETFVGGASVDWGAVFAGSDARRVGLPTYAFQRERFWPVAAPARKDSLLCLDWIAATPVVSEPSASGSSEPSAPVASEPSALGSSEPSAPVASEPSAPVASEPSAPGEWLVLQREGGTLAAGLQGLGARADVLADLKELRARVDGEGSAGDVVLLDCTALPCSGGEAGAGLPGAEYEPGGEPGPGLPRAAHELAGDVLGLVQEWLRDERFASRTLAVVTRGAVAAGAHDPLEGLVASPVWGLLRSAQTESPGRFVLIDVRRAAGVVGSARRGAGSG